MQTFTLEISLPDDADPSAILEWLQANAIELALQASGSDELSADEETAIVDSCSVSLASEISEAA